MNQSPEVDLELSDFQSSGYEDILSDLEEVTYRGLQQAFWTASQETADGGELARSKVLRVLANACSMMLKPGKDHAPFQPLMVCGNQRSKLPEDFSDEEIRLLSQFSQEIKHPWLRARLADLAWLIKKPRDHEDALRAIDAYCQLPLESDVWRSDGQLCWTRAVRLAKMLGQGAGERVAKIEQAIVEALFKATIADLWLARDFAQLLRTERLGREQASSIAEHLELLAGESIGQENVLLSATYWCLAAIWFEDSGDQDKAAEMRIRQAECWAVQAETEEAKEAPNYAAAQAHYQAAIKAYLAVPRRLRAKQKVEARIKELREKLTVSGVGVLDDLHPTELGPVDISKYRAEAMALVRGKEPEEAFFLFVNCLGSLSEEEARKNATQVLQEQPLLGIFSSKVIAPDGRVVADSPGGIAAPGTELFETQVWAEMMKIYPTNVDFMACATIGPAFHVLTLEHRLLEGDFVSIARHSPFIPNGEEELWGKGLYFGYERDFVGSIHLLAPRLESLVRAHLKSHGVVTTVLSEGIESEAGLGSLLQRNEAEQVFGADFIFQAKALFCDPMGLNFRNDLAHGLLGDRELAGRGAHLFYAWWWLLGIVFRPFYVARTSPPSESAESREGSED